MFSDTLSLLTTISLQYANMRGLFGKNSHWPCCKKGPVARCFAQANSKRLGPGSEFRHIGVEPKKWFHWNCENDVTRKSRRGADKFLAMGLHLVTSLGITFLNYSQTQTTASDIASLCDCQRGPAMLSELIYISTVDSQIALCMDMPE
jgi:hypothetical protein